jgi:hypothetical protein
MAAQTTHVSWPFNYELFCVMTILELNGDTSYLGYVSLHDKFLSPLGLVPFGPFLGLCSFPFCNEDCLPFMPKKKKTKQKSLVGSFVIQPISRYYQQLVKSVGSVF